MTDTKLNELTDEEKKFRVRGKKGLVVVSFFHHYKIFSILQPEHFLHR